MSERPLTDPLSDSLVGFMEQQRVEAQKRQISIKVTTSPRRSLVCCTKGESV